MPNHPPTGEKPTPATPVETLADTGKRLTTVLMLTLVGFVLIAIGLGYLQISQTNSVKDLTEETSTVLGETRSVLEAALPEMLTYEQPNPFQITAHDDRETIELTSRLCFVRRIEEVKLRISTRYSFPGGPPAWATQSSYPTQPNVVAFGNADGSIPLDENNCVLFDKVPVRLPDQLIRDLRGSNDGTAILVARYQSQPIDFTDGIEQQGRVVLATSESFTIGGAS